MLRCVYFLISLFIFSFSQFTNEDDESQKFLTNGFLGKKKLSDYGDEHVSESLLSGNKQDSRVSDLPRSLRENSVTEIFQALISTFSVYSGPYWNKGLFFLFAIWLHKSFMKFVFWRNHYNPNIICNHTCFSFFVLLNLYFLIFFIEILAGAKH